MRALAIILAACSAAAQPARQFDVVVVSGSSAGVGAAIGAARLGVTVALVEDTSVLGGMLANGISNSDSYSYESMSGVFEEFRQSVKSHYAPLLGKDPVLRGGPHKVRYSAYAAHDAVEGGRWEPHVADRIFKEMIARLPNVTVFYRTWAVQALKNGSRLVGVVAENAAGEKLTLMGKVVIDATHEGDVAAWAGAPYRVGREARSPLEPHAGKIYYFNATGEILEGSTGEQDRSLVSAGLRLTIKTYPEGETSHLIKTPPTGYDPANYVHTAYTGRPDQPNGKAEMNQNPFGNELQEINWTWPEASRAERLRLYQVYRNHALGFLYYLQHERGLRHLGLPGDEYPDNGNVPYRIFIREARRIEGEVTITESDLNPFLYGNGLLPPPRSDAIAVGHYPIDSKPVRRKTNLDTPDKGEGDFFLVNVSTPFQVPYGAIVPKRVDGLLVPAALSATHVAFSAIRMDPTWTVIGQAAGVAAALSVRRNAEVRELPVELIQRELLKQKCRLMFYWDLPLEHPGFAAIQFLSVRGVVKGYPDRLFRPGEPLTRAELAALLVRALKAPPSVTEFHFKDVPYTHWAFRDIETLFDRHALSPFGVRPVWPEAGGYQPRRDAGFARARAFGEFGPDKPVTWRELAGMLHQHRRSGPADAAAWVQEALRRSEFGAHQAGNLLSEVTVLRAEACLVVGAVIDLGWM